MKAIVEHRKLEMKMVRGIAIKMWISRKHLSGNIGLWYRDKPELLYQHDQSQEAKVWVFPSYDGI